MYHAQQARPPPQSTPEHSSSDLQARLEQDARRHQQKQQQTRRDRRRSDDDNESSMGDSGLFCDAQSQVSSHMGGGVGAGDMDQLAAVASLSPNSKHNISVVQSGVTPNGNSTGGINGVGGNHQAQEGSALFSLLVSQPAPQNGHHGSDSFVRVDDTPRPQSEQAHTQHSHTAKNNNHRLPPDANHHQHDSASIETAEERKKRLIELEQKSARKSNFGLDKQKSILYSLLDLNGVEPTSSSDADDLDDEDEIQSSPRSQARPLPPTQQSMQRYNHAPLHLSKNGTGTANFASTSTFNSRFQLVDNETGQVYLIPEDMQLDVSGRRSSMSEIMQEWVQSGQCSVVGSVLSSGNGHLRIQSDLTSFTAAQGRQSLVETGIPREISSTALSSSNQSSNAHNRDSILMDNAATAANANDKHPPSNSTAKATMDVKNFSAGVTEAYTYSRTRYGNNFVPMLNIGVRRHAHKGPIWMLKISKSGRYLASAGSDGVVCIWKVGMFGEKRDGQPAQTEQARAKNNSEELDIQVLSQEPYRSYDDHSGEDVIDLSWSQSDFFLTASMDRTVKLFHVTKRDCLRTFQHPDYVTSVDFNPADDNVFVSGSFDKRIRLWNIETAQILEWAQAPDLVTCTRFHPQAKTIVAGMMRGQVYFYSAKRGLNYLTQISCKNKHGLRSDGRKVTGLEFRRVTKVVKVKTSKKDEVNGGTKNNPEENNAQSQRNSQTSQMSEDGEKGDDGNTKKKWKSKDRQKKKMIRKSHQLLVTTNDSRVRLYGMDDFCMLQKLRGLKNLSMQIKARFSASGSAVTCGSEDGFVFIWESEVNELKHQKKTIREKMGLHTEHERKKHCAAFQARDPLALTAAITETCFLPEPSVVRSLSVDCHWDDKAFRKKLNEDVSTAFVLSSDYEGTIKVFLRRKFLHNLNNALN